MPWGSSVRSPQLPRSISVVHKKWWWLDPPGRSSWTSIGASAINQLVKAIAIARKNIEEEVPPAEGTRPRQPRRLTRPVPSSRAPSCRLAPSRRPDDAACRIACTQAIDLTCKPEFTEVNEGVTALRMLLLVEQT